MSDIVKVIGKYLDLQLVGSEYKAICPFHSERTPSFAVMPDRAFYYCHGCGASGDTIEFIKEHKGLSFKQSLAKVCEILEVDEKTYMSEKEDKKSEVVKKDKTIPMELEDVKKFIAEIGYKSNGYRGIRDDMNQFFGHLTKLDSSGKVLARYYPETNDDGKVTGYKCRNHPKDFSYGKIGNTGSTSQLSGQVKFKGVSKYILIVGGEEDKVAAYQMLLDNQRHRESISKTGEKFAPIPVVSPTTGENSVKQIAAQYDFLNNYDFIILGLDNDKAGREAVIKLAEVLPKDKVKIATWTGKDPNQMLLDKQEAQFVRDFYNAKEYVSSGISSSSDATGGIDEFLTAPKIPLPPQMHRIQEKGRGGIRSTGAIVNIIGDTSIGKSFFSDTLFYYWIFNSPIIPTIISLERTKEELAIDIESLHLKKNLLWFKDGHDAVAYRNHPDVVPLLENLHTNEFGEPRYYIIDERDGGIDALKAQMKRAAIKHGSKLFILDPLTDFLRALGTEAQEDFMMWEKREKKNGYVFINILHTRKPPTDKDGKVRFVTEYDALGSGTFPQSADVNLVLNRDKMATDIVTRNTTIVDIPKWRGGSTGRVDGGLYYDAESRQQYDLLDWMASSSKPNELSEPPVIESPPIESYEVESVIGTDEDVEWN